jgi:nucleotide-binding universal stress UspA family protein
MPSTLHLAVVLVPDEADSAVTPHALLEEGARAYLSELAAELQARGPGAANVRISWSVLHGLDVAGALIDLARGEFPARGVDTEPPASGFDVIAMATHGYTGREYWALGSVTERVLEGARLPLLIRRPAAAEVEAAQAAGVTAGEQGGANA